MTQAEPVPQEPDARTAASPALPAAVRRSRRLALLAASLGFSVVQLDVSVVNVAIRPIGAELGGGVSGLQWVVSAYTVAFASLILSAGALGDRVGARRVFMAGFALFTAASAACGCAPSLGMLITARAVQGAGAAVLVPCSLTLLNHTHRDPNARARAIGLWAAGASVALAGGPLAGGVLTAAFGWRSIFFINAPIGLAGIWLTCRYAAETTRSPGRGFDLPGQAAAIVFMVALAGATVAGGRRGFASPPVLAGFGLAAVAFAAFVGLEARRRAPMLPLGLFRSPVFAVATAIGLLANIAFYGLIFVLSLYFQDVRHYPVLVTGLAFVPTTVAILAANLLAGRLAGALGVRRLVICSALVMTAGLAGLLLAEQASFAVLAIPLAATGLGLGLIIPAITAALLGSVDASQSGVASGTLNTARQAGSVIGVALFGSLAAAGLSGGLRRSALVAALLALAVAGLAAGLRSRRDPDEPSPA